MLGPILSEVSGHDHEDFNIFALARAVRRADGSTPDEAILSPDVSRYTPPPPASRGAFMRTVALPRVSAFVLIASCLLFAHQQPTTPASPPQTNAPAQQQPTNPSAPPPPMSLRNSLRYSRRQVSLAGSPPRVPELRKLRRRRLGRSSTPHALETKRAIAQRRSACWV